MPSIFIILGIIYGIVQLVGILLIKRADLYKKQEDATKEAPNTIEGAPNTIEGAPNTVEGALNTVEETLSKESKSKKDATPFEALKQPTFYWLWIIFALGAQIVPLINSQWKVRNLNFL